MRLRPFGRTPLIDFRRIIALRGRHPAAAPLELTCYGKADCSLCDKAKVPIERIVRLSNGRIVARWVDILADDALAARWGERIPVVCVGETMLAEGKISEVWLGRAIEKYLRERESGK
jgi:hypothetical protein